MGKLPPKKYPQIFCGQIKELKWLMTNLTPWSDPDVVWVILRKMFWVFCCRPLKFCLQLLLLLEKDSSFNAVQNTTQGYCFQLVLDNRHPTTFMENSLYSIQEGSWNKISYEHDHWLLWLTYKKLISMYLGFWLLVWYGILYVTSMADGLRFHVIWRPPTSQLIGRSIKK